MVSAPFRFEDLHPLDGKNGAFVTDLTGAQKFFLKIMKTEKGLSH